MAGAQLKVENLQAELQQGKKATPGACAKEAFREVVAKHAAAFKGKIEHDGFDESLGQLLSLVETLEQQPTAEEGGDHNVFVDIDQHANIATGEGFDFYDPAKATAAVQATSCSAEAKKMTAESMGDMAVAFRRLRSKIADDVPPAPAPVTALAAPVLPPGGAQGQTAEGQRAELPTR